MTWPFENDTGTIVKIPKGFHGGYYGAAVLLTVVVCWFMVSISVHRPVKIAANISPLEAMRFSAGQEKVHNRKKHRKLSPISVPVPANGAIPPGVVWHGGSPVCLDGAQAEKAIPG